MTTVRILLGSMNETKKQAIHEAIVSFGEIFREASVECVEVDSIDQPFNEDVKKGGISRARNALLLAGERSDDEVRYGIGIEGGIVKYQGTWYITAYCHVIRDDGEEHGAWTSFLECPKNVLDSIKREGQSLGNVVERMRTEKHWETSGGAFGTLTSGRHTRFQALRDALILSFSPFFIKT
jgi:inosine/xanthosine triphosphatase